MALVAQQPRLSIVLCAFQRVTQFQWVKVLRCTVLLRSHTVVTHADVAWNCLAGIMSCEKHTSPLGVNPSKMSLDSKKSATFLDVVDK